MDYQEAIEIIEYASAFNSDNSRLTKALNTAISAVQELQALHDQGISMERLKDIDFRKSVVEHINYDTYMSMKEDMEEYKQLGTLEELRETVKELKLYKDAKLCLIPEDVFSKQCEEVDAYRELGTLEELEMLKATHFTGAELIKIAIDLKQLNEYKKIGTPEEVRDAVEKQRAKRAKIKMLCRDIEYWCPNCRESHIVMHSKKGLDYCHHCGQKLDWSNKDDR